MIIFINTIDEHLIYINGEQTNYTIRRDGTVRNILSDKILKHDIGKRGYHRVTLSINGISRKYLVHRLVAKEFIYNDDPDNKIVVNHKDGNKHNNTVVNLEWCTYAYNMAHAIATGLRPLMTKTVYDEECIHVVCQMLEDKHNITNIVRVTGVIRQTVYHITHNGQWQHISSEYNIDYDYYNRPIVKTLDDETRRIILDMLGEDPNLPPSKIASILEIDATKKNLQCISDIKIYNKRRVQRLAREGSTLK